MDDANLEVAHRHHLPLRERGVVVELPAHHVQVAAHALEVVVHLLHAQVARAQHVLDLSGHQQRLQGFRV